MTQFPLDARVSVRPIAQRREGASVTIGDLSRQVFLTIPAEGMELLTALADGKTVGEALRRYEDDHDETPDVEDFLTALAAEGFVARADDAAPPPWAEPPPVPSLGRISPAAARRLFSVPVLCLCAVLVGTALALVAADPRVVPGPAVLVFPAHIAAMGLALGGAALAGLFAHEFAHLLAARACGVPARIRPGRRLWFLVAETDMSGIWMAPTAWRYLSFVAGAIVDAVSAALLVGVLWAQRRGWIALPAGLEQLTGAVLFSYLMRLLWQCFFFVRTDLYYVLATALGCKRLLADTEDLLRNRWARWRGSSPPVDQSGIPPAEMRAIRWYAVVWLGGRALAFGCLFGVTLPLLAGYGIELARAATGHSRYGTFDLLTLVAFGLILQGAGLWIWINSFRRRRTQGRNDALAAT
jgi:putative peptide zinc metalloprotease protein